MRHPSRRRGPTSLVVLSLLGLSASFIACEGQHSSSTARYAKRFLPTSDTWIPETSIPSAPQVEPHMVIWEVSEFDPEFEQTPAQRNAADELEASCLAAARKNDWFDFQRGLDDGYKLLPGDRRHYYNEEFLFDDRQLDCERPEFLMYYGTPKGKILTGMMFYVSDPDGHGPQVGGPETLWHFHVWNQEMCLRDGLLILSQAQDRHCPKGEPSFRSPEMLHVWLLDHPNGRFATTMWLTREQLEDTLVKREAEATR